MLIKYLAKAAICAVFAILFSGFASAQAEPAEKPPAKTQPPAAIAGPKITQIDIDGLKTLLVPKGRPLLINFWATWCDPCREEFPDLVKIDTTYKGKLDVITVSLDDVEDIDTLVPKFLKSVNATMPAYLLRTTDENAAIALVNKDWSGSLPMTVIYGTDGKLSYQKSGKFKTEVLTQEIDKALKAPTADIRVVMDFVKIKNGRRDEAMFYYENNWKVYREAALRDGFIHSYEIVEASSEKNKAFDIVLITRFADEAQANAVEKNFEPILSRLRPNGPILKNEIKPADFRENVFVYNGRSPFSSFNGSGMTAGKTE